MRTTIRSCAALIISLLALTPLTGCTFLAFSDSSAMRIEVEVYKGPLSLEPEIQLQELYGYLLEAYMGTLRTYGFAQLINSNSGARDSLSSATLDTVLKDSEILMSKLERSLCAFTDEPEDCVGNFSNVRKLLKSDTLETDFQGPDFPVPPNTSWKIRYENLDKATKQRFEKAAINLAREYTAKFKDTVIEKEAAIKSVLSVKWLRDGTTPDKLDKLADVLADISRTAAGMQVTAFRYATSSTAGQPPDSFARIAATYYIQAASEYGNQLEARADALLKQLGKHGHDRRELPLSTHLREAEPTDFLHLFDWLNGHIPRAVEYFYLVTPPNVMERIKIVERLYGDHFWSKINTVYASGRGKTQMAFIKDETGNWNLKSFDNDPTELLEAYTEVAKTALKKAAEAAAAASTGGGSGGILAAQKLLELAAQSELKPNQLSQQTAPAGTLSLDHLRTRLMDKLDPAQFEADFKKEQTLINEVDDKEKAASQLSGGSDKKPAAATELTNAQEALWQHRQQVIRRWEGIVNDHSNLVDILSSTVKKK